MGRIDAGAVRLFCPDFADIRVWRWALQSLESAGEVVGVDEVAEVGSKLVVGLVVVEIDRRLLEGSVHSFDLSASPWMARLGEPMADVQASVGMFEDVRPDDLSRLDGGVDLQRG